MNAKSLGRILFFVSFAALLAGIAIYMTRPEYPFQRSIKNTEGKKVEALITGKIADTVYFTRLPDREEFTLTLDKLAYRDRFRLWILEEQAPPPKPAPVPPEFSDNYIENREEKIAELNKKLDIMKYEYKSGTLNPIMKENYKKRLANIEHEIKTLDVAIETYLYRLKKRK